MRYMARLSWFEGASELYENRNNYSSKDRGSFIPTLRFNDKYADWYKIVKDRLTPLNLGWKFFDNDQDYLAFIDKHTTNNKYDKAGKLILGPGAGCFPDIVDFDDIYTRGSIPMIDLINRSLEKYTSPDMARMPESIYKAASVNPDIYERWVEINVKKAEPKLAKAVWNLFPELHTLSFSTNKDLFFSLLNKDLNANEVLELFDGLNSRPKYENDPSLVYDWEAWNVLDIKPSMDMDDNEFAILTRTIFTAYDYREEEIVLYIEDKSKQETIDYIKHESQTNELLQFLADLFLIVFTKQSMHDTFFTYKRKLSGLTTKIQPGSRDTLITLLRTNEISVEKIIPFIDDDLNIFLDAYRSGVPIEDVFA